MLSQRYVPPLRADEEALRQAIVALAAGLWPLRLPPGYSPAQERELDGE